MISKEILWIFTLQDECSICNHTNYNPAAAEQVNEWACCQKSNITDTRETSWLCCVLELSPIAFISDTFNLPCCRSLYIIYRNIQPLLWINIHWALPGYIRKRELKMVLYFSFWLVFIIKYKCPNNYDKNTQLTFGHSPLGWRTHLIMHLYRYIGFSEELFQF